MRPPLILALFIQLVGAANGGSCETFTRDSILFDDPRHHNNRLLARYINNVEEQRFILYCYLVTVDAIDASRLAVITTLEDKHMVTIKNLDCKSTEELFTNTYMFLHSREGGTRNYLAVGVLPYRSTTWCRIDVCLNCYISKARTNTDSTPNERFFRWSQPGIPIKSVTKGMKPIYYPYITALSGTKYYFHDHLMVAEYLSVGYPKFVLHCYLMTGTYYALVRTTKGRLIFSVDDFNCSPGQPLVNMFYVLTQEQKNDNGSKKSKRDSKKQELNVNLYELGGEATDKDWAWYNGGGDQTEYTRHLYYFTGDQSEKNCYWKQIVATELNSCPSLPNSDIMEYTDSDDYFFIKHKDTEEVAKYTNGGNSQFTLTCFRTTEDTNAFYSVVTDNNGDHVITVKDIDCTSKDNIEGSFYVDTVYDDMDLDHLVISSRVTLDEDWCTYYYHKKHDDSTRGYFIRKWVYYDYEPKNGALNWNKVSGEATPESEGGKGRTPVRKKGGNLNVSSMASIAFPKEECVPRYKEPKDLGFAVNTA